MGIVWKQNVNGVAQLPILFTNDIANGFPADYDTVDLADITNADIAMSNGNIYVVWQDDNSGTVKYRNGTYNPIITSVKEIVASDIFVFPNPVTSTITFKSNLELQNAEIKIIDVLGKTNLSFHEFTNSKLDVSGLTNGVYILQVKTYNNFFNLKFIKQ